MKKPKVKIAIMIASTLLLIATIGLIISMSQIDKQTEATTTFYTATVIDVDVTDTGDTIFAEIHTKEYTTSLYISPNICKSDIMDDVRGLKNGQTITFGIENIKAKQMNKVEFVDITSLKTDSKEILTLEQYNKCIHNSAFPARITSIVTALIFLSISIFCCLTIRKNKVLK